MYHMIRSLWAEGRRGGLMHDVNRSLGTALEYSPLLVVTEVDKLDKFEETAVWGEISNEESILVSKMFVPSGTGSKGVGSNIVAEGTAALILDWLSGLSFEKLRKSRKNCFCLWSLGATTGLISLTNLPPRNDSMYIAYFSLSFMQDVVLSTLPQSMDCTVLQRFDTIGPRSVTIMFSRWGYLNVTTYWIDNCRKEPWHWPSKG